MQNREYYLYITMNWYRTVIYVGVTGNLDVRMAQHKSREVNGFTSKYFIDRLVYYETFQYVYDAIEREKQIKRWSRSKKLNLIKTINPKLEDLSTPSR
ncbi:hypothetical protein CL634_07860 [bacterium]|nr:hypothetical protein [bacterium]